MLDDNLNSVEKANETREVEKKRNTTHFESSLSKIPKLDLMSGGYRIQDEENNLDKKLLSPKQEVSSSTSPLPILSISSRPFGHINNMKPYEPSPKDIIPNTFNDKTHLSQSSLLSESSSSLSHLNQSLLEQQQQAVLQQAAAAARLHHSMQQQNTSAQNSNLQQIITNSLLYRHQEVKSNFFNHDLAISSKPILETPISKFSNFSPQNLTSPARSSSSENNNNINSMLSERKSPICSTDNNSSDMRQLYSRCCPPTSDDEVGPEAKLTTSFSVVDILDPCKFTGRLGDNLMDSNPSEDDEDGGHIAGECHSFSLLFFQF